MKPGVPQRPGEPGSSLQKAVESERKASSEAHGSCEPGCGREGGLGDCGLWGGDVAVEGRGWEDRGPSREQAELALSGAPRL